MSVLSELKTRCEGLSLPVQTGEFSGIPPDTYVVLTPILDDFTVFADDIPVADSSDVRISLYTKSNYLATANALVLDLLYADFQIDERRYIGKEDDYYHYSIDVVKEFDYEME
jgi:hypothetical protein